MFSPVNATRSPPSSSPIRFSAGTSTSSKNTCQLRSGWFMTVRIFVIDSPGASASTMNTDSRPRPVASSWLGARDDHHPVGAVHAGDEDLLAVEHVAVAAAVGPGGDAMGVGAGVGLGDRERQPRLAARDRRAASAPSARRWRCGRGSCPSRPDENSIACSGQPAIAVSSTTIASSRQPEAAAAVLLGQVDAEIALLAERAPQLGAMAARCRPAPGSSRARTRARCRRPPRAARAARRSRSARCLSGRSCPAFRSGEAEPAAPVARAGCPRQARHELGPRR